MLLLTHKKKGQQIADPFVDLKKIISSYPTKEEC